MAPLKVIIIGAGLAGSLLANGLLRNKIDITVYERDDESANRKGYQIRLGAHALAGFKACLSPEQLEYVLSKFGRSGGVVASAPALFDKDLNLQLDLSKFPAYTKSAPINRALLRDLLQAPLRDKGILRYGKDFVRYELLDDGGIRAYFKDGYIDDADILIGADGNVSKINRQVGCNNLVELKARKGFLAKGDLPASTLMTLPKDFIKMGSLSCIADDMVVFAADCSSTPADSKASFIDGSIAAYHEEEASFMFGVQFPATVYTGDIGKIEDKRAFIKDQLLTNWSPGYHQLVDAISLDDIYVVRGRASKPLSRKWRENVQDPSNPQLGNSRVWLIGDAIHAMMPARGMGANQALHDCADALHALIGLADAAKSSDVLEDRTVAEFVNQYESRMMPRAFSWVQKSGGTNEKLPNFDGIKGRILIFCLARVLDITGFVMKVAGFWGWKPADDLEEFE